MDQYYARFKSGNIGLAYLVLMVEDYLKFKCFGYMIRRKTHSVALPCKGITKRWPLCHRDFQHTPPSPGPQPTTVTTGC